MLGSRTIFVGSSCNDLAISKSSGTLVFSGHHDKKLRVYDLRTNNEATAEIHVLDKITSVALLNSELWCSGMLVLQTRIVNYIFLIHIVN